jgi:hypothetical protein
MKMNFFTKVKLSVFACSLILISHTERESESKRWQIAGQNDSPIKEVQSANNIFLLQDIKSFNVLVFVDYKYAWSRVQKCHM